MRVLFLGGAGMIGSAAAAEVVRQGHELTVVTRGEPRRPVPAAARQIRADVYKAAELRTALRDASRAAAGGEWYDAVVNWVGYRPADLDGHVELFGARAGQPGAGQPGAGQPGAGQAGAGQYVFVSTCSVFARPVPSLPVTESSPRRQPVFRYAGDKIDCEEHLAAAYRATGFPVTIVRPAHVYDQTVVPVLADWTAIDRMRSGKPVIVHGDGTSLWSLMHAADFARALVPLLGNGQAIGESVNIVSGDILTWDQIHLELGAAAAGAGAGAAGAGAGAGAGAAGARAAGAAAPVLAHRTSEAIGREWPAWADVLEHDFRHSMVFSNDKLRRLVPGFAPLVTFSAGAREIISWHDADAARRHVDADLDAAFERLLAT